MSIWFKRVMGISAETMRQAALSVGVSWDEQPIQYKQNRIGYKNGDSSDKTAIQDELQSVLGYRPVVVDDPTTNTENDSTQ
jgi:hypothetical protein